MVFAPDFSADPIIDPTVQVNDEYFYPTLDDILPGYTPPPQLGLASALQPALAPTLNLPGFRLANPALNNPTLTRNAPKAYTTFQNKWSTLTPQIPQLVAKLSEGRGDNRGAVNALLKYDGERVGRGQAPLTMDETLKVLRTALTNKAATPDAEPSPLNLPVNAFRDLTNILTALPRLPVAVAKEITALPTIPAKIAEAQEQGDNIIQAVAEAPGVRLLPGAYAVGSLAAGGEGIKELARHPISTLLDVLTAAQAAGVGPKIAASPIGTFGRKVVDAAKPTRLGQFAQGAFSDLAREQAIAFGKANWESKVGQDPSLPSRNVSETLGKEATVLAQRFLDEVPPERRTLVFDLAEQGTWDLPGADITAAERALLIAKQDYNYRAAAETADLNLTVNGDFYGQTETFTPQKWKAITRARTSALRYNTFAPLADAIRSQFSATRPSFVADPTDIYRQLVDTQQVAEFMQHRQIPKASKQNYLTGIAQLHDIAGVSLPAGYKRLVRAGRIDEALQTLESHTPTIATAAATQPTLTRAQRWLATNKVYTPKAALRHTRNAEAVQLRNAPDRWQPHTQTEIANRVEKALVDRGYLVSTHPNFETISDYMRDSQFKMMVDEGLITERELFNWRTEAEATILDMRAQGVDPIFMHHVPTSKATQPNFPKPLNTIRDSVVGKPSQVQARTMDATPYTHNFAVSITHQGMELLNYRNSLEFLRTYLATEAVPGAEFPLFARKYGDLYRQYMGAAQRDISAEFGIDHKTAIAQRIDREWDWFRVDQLPENLRNDLGVPSVATRNHPDAIYLPKYLSKNFDLFTRPQSYGSIFDKVTNAFRMSVLPFSPRWHINNVTSGAVMVTARTDPTAIVRYMADSLELNKAIRAGDEAEMLASGVTQRFRRTLGSTSEPYLEWHYHAGRQQARWYAESAIGEAAKQGIDAVQALATKSHELNGLVDDMYRTITFLYGRDKALLKAANDGIPIGIEDAGRIGERLARKTMMTFDKMTPLERSILRSVFPFYGFMQHIISYAWQYPIDHPFRAAITSSFARNELDDLGTGLPQTFLNSLFLGNPDEDGNVTSLQLSGMNPFKDVANYMTLTGFMSGLNPIFSSILEQVGVDTRQGGATLYPNVRYDAASGRMRASHPNPITNFIYNTIPQTQVLTGIMDRGSELQSALHRDPASGVRMVLSQVGVPILWRDYNVPTEQFKAELNRQRGQAEALSQALETGDYTSAVEYPALRPLLGQVSFLQRQNALGGYDITDQLSALQGAISKEMVGVNA